MRVVFQTVFRLSEIVIVLGDRWTEIVICEAFGLEEDRQTELERVWLVRMIMTTNKKVNNKKKYAIQCNFKFIRSSVIGSHPSPKLLGVVVGGEICVCFFTPSYAFFFYVSSGNVHLISRSCMQSTVKIQKTTNNPP